MKQLPLKVIGNIESMWNLGDLWLSGDLGNIDYGKALEYFEKASNTGRADYIYSFGIELTQGDIEIRDYERGISLIHQAISVREKETYNNSIDAAVNIAGIYYDGDLGEPNYIEAAKWYIIAANLGDIESKYYIVKIYLVKLEEKNIKLATKYIEQIFNSNDEYYIVKKTMLLLPHLLKAENQPDGIDWFITQALLIQDAQTSQTQYNSEYSLLQNEIIWQLSNYYLDSEYEQVNHPEAIKWLNISGSNGHGKSLQKLLQLKNEGYLQDYTDLIQKLNRYEENEKYFNILSGSETNLSGQHCNEEEII